MYSSDIDLFIVSAMWTVAVNAPKDSVLNSFVATGCLVATGSSSFVIRSSLSLHDCGEVHGLWPRIFDAILDRRVASGRKISAWPKATQRGEVLAHLHSMDHRR